MFKRTKGRPKAEFCTLGDFLNSFLLKPSTDIPVCLKIYQRNPEESRNAETSHDFSWCLAATNSKNVQIKDIKGHDLKTVKKRGSLKNFQFFIFLNQCFLKPVQGREIDMQNSEQTLHERTLFRVIHQIWNNYAKNK